MIECADEGGGTGSRRLSNACLVHIDGILDLFMADDGFHRQVLMKLLHRQILVMLVFVLVHHGCSEDISPIPSFFQ